MAFSLPNAASYGTAIASLEQAEPDALDFQILGDRRNFVISGGDVTSITSSLTGYVDVVLNATEVYLNGQYGTISGATVTVSDAPTSGTRFDIICARYDGGAFSFYVATGTASASNPVFPVIPPVGVSGSFMPLYAVIVRADLETTTLSRVYVDKRTYSSPAVIKTGSASPSGGSSGELYYKTGSVSSGQSNLWVNVGGTWQNLASYTNPVVSTATASTIALRDASADLYANTFRGAVVGNVTGAVTGNASTATALQTSRSFSVTGDMATATGVSFDGTGDVSLSVTTTLPRAYVQSTAPSSGSVKANDIWIQV